MNPPNANDDGNHATDTAHRVEDIAIGIVIAVVVVAGLYALNGSEMNSRSALPMMLAGIMCVIGAIHGATDFAIARKTLTRLPRQISYFFAYATLAITTTLLLFRWPLPMLFLLLALGAWHFGYWHVRHERHAVVRNIMALAIGMMPIWAAVMFQPEQCREIFNLLVGDRRESATVIVRGLQAAWPILVGGVLCFCLRLVQMTSGTMQSTSTSTSTATPPQPAPTTFEFRRSMLHLLLSAALFAVLPVFLAFAVFFALLHAPLHSRDVLAAPRSTRNRILLEAILLTVFATVMLGVFLLNTLPSDPGTLPAAILAGLLAITLPHALNDVLIRLFARRLQ
jgi:Brp/Blh family beta-carotene 15,15'-monooxygenase